MTGAKKAAAECAVALELYEYFGNPLFAWKVYRICREHGLPIPIRVLEYLDSVTCKLLDPDYYKTRGATWARDALSLSAGRGEKYYREYERELVATAVAEDVAVQLGIDEGLHDGEPTRATVKEAIYRVIDKWRGQHGVELKYAIVHKWYYQERRAEGAREALASLRISGRPEEHS